jgi:hypothetical protein
MNFDLSQLFENFKNMLSEKLSDNVFVEKLIKELINQVQMQFKQYIYIGLGLYAVILILLILILYKLYKQ